MSQGRGEPWRYGVTVVLGLVVDLASARGAVACGAPVEWAAVLGVACGAAFNYVLLERWVFQGARQDAATTRPLRYLTVVMATMALRAGAVWMLQAVLPAATPVLAVLAGGAAMSFVAQFLLSKYWVFRTTHGCLDDPGWQVPEFSALELAPKRHDGVLIIPVLNEGSRIMAQLRDLAAFHHPVDIVIADGGSTDGSLEPDFLRGMGVRARLTKIGAGKLSAQLRMGYAWALRQHYTGILTVDGNGKDGMEAIAGFLHRLRDGYDYIQGSRYLPGGGHENTPLIRTLANRLIHAPLLSLASGHWLTDTTNGFRAYSARYLLDPRVQPFREVFQRYELLFYLTVRAGQIGMNVCQIPVQRHYPRYVPTPTKIVGFGAKLDVLRQTLAAALGRFAPEQDASRVSERHGR